jgi:hypothetical protein
MGMVGPRIWGLVAILVLLVGTASVQEFTNPHPGMSWEPPPGAMPVEHVELGDSVTFHCYAYNPCAEVVVDLDSDLTHLRVHVEPGLNGSYTAWADPPPGSEWDLGDTHYGTSAIFDRDVPLTTDHSLPFGAKTWRLLFGPTSGAVGSDVTVTVERVPTDRDGGTS